MNEYYLLQVGTNGKLYDDPFLIGLHSKPLSSKKQTIQWMQIGQGASDDYRFASRIAANKFKCVDTKEVFIIKDRGGFTVKAWDDFINSYKN